MVHSTHFDSLGCQRLAAHVFTSGHPSAQAWRRPFWADFRPAKAGREYEVPQLTSFLRQATLYQVSRSPFYFEAKAAYKKSRRTKMFSKMFWCCTNTDDAEDMALPQLHNSEQVLPFGKELTKELKLLQRSQTAAKLIDKASPDFFTIRLHRTPGSSFGLDVSAVGRVCMVNDVHPNSLVGEWNQQCLEEGDPKQVVQQ